MSTLRPLSAALASPLLLLTLATACGSSHSSNGAGGSDGESGAGGSAAGNAGGGAGTGGKNGGGNAGSGASSAAGGGAGTGGKNGGGNAGSGASSAAGGGAGSGGKNGGGNAGSGASSAAGGGAGSGGKNGGGNAGSGASSAAGGGAGGKSQGGSGGKNGGGMGGDGGNGVPGAECATSTDCTKYPTRPVCDPTYDICVECLTKADCKNPESPICQDNSCIECLSDADCSSHPNGPHCEMSTHNCTCKSNSECTTSKKGKLCDIDGLERCGECISSFDCKNPALPACSFDDVCIVGSACQGDDSGENADDGPLGATDITPPPPIGDPLPITTSNGATNRGICDLPLEEADWYKFTIDNGSRVVLTVDWADATADLDVVVMDSVGTVYGFNYNQRPAVVTLTHLPGGVYYANVNRSAPYDKLSVNVTSYNITVERTFESGCSSSADCAAEYATQLYRGICEPFSGECRFIDGGGHLDKGNACDSDNDCKSGFCSYTSFERNASSRSFCTDTCDETATPPVGCPGDQICTQYGDPAICVAKCSTDDECYAYVSDTPPAGETWAYLHCNTATGACENQ